MTKLHSVHPFILSGSPNKTGSIGAVHEYFEPGGRLHTPSVTHTKVLLIVKTINYCHHYHHHHYHK